MKKVAERWHVTEGLNLPKETEIRSRGLQADINLECGGQNILWNISLEGARLCARERIRR